MTEDDFLTHYPRLFHIAEAGSWQSIQKFGLESTSAILDRYEVSGPERDRIESEWRPNPVPLNHDKFGSVVIRDQAPISETKLANCLVGMTTADWFRMLNGFVFLWPWSGRRDGMLGSYEDQRHDVLTIDSKKLLSRHGDKILLSPINSGNTQYDAAERGRDTFVRLSDCPFPDWRRRRKKKPEEVVAEVTLPYRLHDVEEVVLRVESYSGSQRTGTVWEPAT